jgi:periplasmic protein TonB
MTLVADRFDRRDRGELLRWGGSLAIVLALHAALALWLITHRVWIEPPGMPAAAVMVDLAPLPQPLPAPLPEPMPASPPVVEQAVQPPPPPAVEQPPPPPPLPEVPTTPILPRQPAVVLPKPLPAPPKVHPPKPVATPLPTPPPPAAPIAPAVAAPPQPSAAAIAGARATWQAQIVAWLARHKQYPRTAQAQHQQGTALLHFTIDRQGHVLSHQLARGSGFTLLDEEAEALIQRAQPLPAPPSEMPGQQIELTVPIQFTLH